MTPRNPPVSSRVPAGRKSASRTKSKLVSPEVPPRHVSAPASRDVLPALPEAETSSRAVKVDAHEHGPGHHHDHTTQARELLRQRGLRITGSRLALLTTLLDNHRPTSAQELITAVAQQGIDQVTVYRTLNTLVEEGIAQAVGTTDRGRRFEVHACAGCRIDHPHLQCRRCGLLECMEQGLLPALMVPTSVGKFLVEEAKLYLYGVCGSCLEVQDKDG